MQSLLRPRLRLHQSYLIVIICTIKDNGIIVQSLLRLQLGLLTLILFSDSNDNNAISTVTAVRGLSFISDL